ncbi:MAG: hypothetical protein COA77_07930 [Thaumarchaeota archaeon]|nr:MAG: hypothetical protein COA77_07930 [Nitrososphaerota archaeon]
MSRNSYRAEMMQYYDEVLAQSARNYAFTSNKKWEQRYREVEPLSDKILKDAIKKAGVSKRGFFSRMDSANQKLVKMEYTAIDYVNNDKPKQAIELLDSEEYLKQREILAGGLEKFIKKYHEKELEFTIISKPVLDVIELERRLAVLEKQLDEEKFTTVGRFASKMAHDLRNPLSIIQLSLENLKLLYGVDAKKQKQFDKVDRSIDRIVHQVDDVLDFVREIPIKLEKITLSEIIHESLDSITIPDNIKLILPKDDFELICDKRQLAVGLNNLILNSVQAIKDKGTVTLMGIEKNDSIVITIEDSGSGISKNRINDIFEPLFTTKQQGTGLGLASVKSIIKAHAGTISVTSPPTVFTITLPKTNS